MNACKRQINVNLLVYKLDEEPLLRTPPEHYHIPLSLRELLQNSDSNLKWVINARNGRFESPALHYTHLIAPSIGH